MGVVCRFSIAPVVLALGLVVLSVRPALAGEPWSDVSLMVVSIGMAGLPAAPAEAPVPAMPPTSAQAHPDIRATAARPAPLAPLYLSFAALQGLDAFTTIRGLNRGAVEANPLMGGVAGNRAALVAAKVGMAGATVWLTERLWKRNRGAAVAMMAVLNGMYAAVVAHNWQVAR